MSACLSNPLGRSVMRQFLAFVLSTLLTAGVIYSCSTAHAQPAATTNPCRSFLDEPRNRQRAALLAYNGVDKLAAPMDKPAVLPSRFATDPYPACVLVEVVLRDQGGQLVIERQAARGVYPNRRNDLLPAYQQAAEQILQQVPLAKVLPRKLAAGVPHLIAVPLWAGHGFYGNDGSQVIGNDLRELGYSDAEKIAEKDGVTVYKVYDAGPRDATLIYVALRTLGENDPIAEFEEITPRPGSFDKLQYKGAIARILHEMIAPSLRDRPGRRAVVVEVRHYARGLQIKFDAKNTGVSLPLANDPKTRHYADHPLFESRHAGLRSRDTDPYTWTDTSVGPRSYSTIGELNKLLAELNVPQEEKARRAQKAKEEADRAEAERQADIDARQKKVAERKDPNNPLASLGYPNAALLFKQGRATYYLSEIAANRPVAVAVHEVGEKERIFDLVPGPEGGQRYPDAQIALARQKLAPAATARWKGLERLVVHHHVRGMPRDDTPEFRKWVRSQNLEYVQPLFEEEYGVEKGETTWRPLYEIGTWSPQRAIDARRHEFYLTVAEARAAHAEKVDAQRFAQATPEQRKAQLREKRLKEQATRSPHYVYKSDRYWIDHPRFYIPQQVFNGDFSAFQIRTQFPRHFNWFVDAYSGSCADFVPRPREHRIIITQPVRTDKWGFTTADGPPRRTDRYIETRFVTKYDEYERVVGLAMLQEFANVFFSGDLDKAPERFAEAGWNKVKEIVGVAFAWKKFFNEHECTSATLFQMRENMWRAATGQPSLQAAGIPVANAAAETEPLVPAPQDMTIFDACYEDHEYKKREFCMCMDEQAQRVMRPEERRRYSADFSLFYKENVFPEKKGPGDPRWRLHVLVETCAKEEKSGMR